MKYIVMLNALIVVLTVGFGVYYLIKDDEKSKKMVKKVLTFNVGAFVPLMVIAMSIIGMDYIYADEAVKAASSASGNSLGLGYLGAALATGLATIGTGIAVGSVGSSALGAVSENPKILGKTLIFVGLAEGIAIYGLIISILIIGKL